jgi:hypothetical protein
MIYWCIFVLGNSVSKVLNLIIVFHNISPVSFIWSKVHFVGQGACLCCEGCELPAKAAHCVMVDLAFILFEVQI